MTMRALRRRQSFSLALGGVAAGWSSSAAAQSYPSQPIRVVVPFVAGGTTDLIGRLVAENLRKSFNNHSVVVDNRPGAGGMVGAESVIKAPPDGYTLLVSASPPLTTSNALFPQRNFDPTTQLTAVASLSVSHYVLVVHPSLPVTNMAELIAYARSKPGELTYASPGVGTASHLIGVMFGRAAGIDIVHVPYQGSGQSRADLLAGRVPMMFENVAVVTQIIRSGQVRPIATTRRGRLDWAPEIPTLAEVGFPQIKVETVSGVFAPLHTPTAIVDLLNRKVGEMLKEPSVLELLRSSGTEPLAMSPQELSKLIAEAQELWGGVVRTAGVRAE
jgi:tripartite-type tricarboxylate transporter receptor subunit TctC